MCTLYYTSDTVIHSLLFTLHCIQYHPSLTTFLHHLNYLPCPLTLMITYLLLMMYLLHPFNLPSLRIYLYLLQGTTQHLFNDAIKRYVRHCCCSSSTTVLIDDDQLSKVVPNSTTQTLLCSDMCCARNDHSKNCKSSRMVRALE